MDATLLPVGTDSSAHGITGLDPDSYTAHKLKHATPEHLHLTTRRFFIGPIPEGWLSSNRKSWYKRRLELSSYSSRAATFHAAEGQAHHHRTVTSLDRANARISFSFPQPDDVDEDEPTEQNETTEETEDKTEDEFFEPTELQPVSTEAQQPAEPPPSEEEVAKRRSGSASLRKTQNRGPSHTLDGEPDVSPSDTRGPPASESVSRSTRTDLQDFRLQVTRSASDAQARDSNQISVTDTRTSSVRQSGLDVQHDNVDTGSQTRLLSPARSPNPIPQSGDTVKSGKGVESPRKHDPTPMSADSNDAHLQQQSPGGVRFKVGEALADRQLRVGAGQGADSTRQRVGRKIARRQTLQEGTIVKMEKMLVKIDFTVQQVPEEYDENESIKLETTRLEKWREFMVTARRSKESDDEDFRLQFYKTRVIPEIDDTSTKKKPTREIKLIRKTTHVNLYSSLDKSVVIWHPYKNGTRITVMKCESAANSNEWYSFLKDALGWKRPGALQVSVPDLGVTLQIEKPFEDLQRAASQEDDEETAIAKAIEAEQAVAGKIISQCIDMLRGNPEWTSVIEHWSASFKPGLAWKRYDRLEWVYGVSEQKMYGSMAMQQSYELELRPKAHYPQHVFGKKGKEHEEPAPIEGFLIRMTSQKGVHKRMGKTFFKRLYFSTHDHFLVFNRPAQATPPHPPRLQTISSSDVPSSRDIIEQTPIMYDIDPFPLDESSGPKQVKWLASADQERIRRNDNDALEEARRNHANLSSSDGYLNMTRIRVVRKMNWGTDSADETLSSGSDVDFHEYVPDTPRPDGTTSTVDDDRIFELILDNGLVVRLQAYDKKTRDEWIARLKQLVKYWKLRKAADISIFKSVRATNLHRLKIDEDVEAELGQFGHKWEVARTEASPELYNICPISSCRTISLSGLLYRKARRHGTFQRCGVVLTGGKMLIYQSTLRKLSGAQIAHIHQEKQQVIDLKGCYVYSGLVVEDDLLYQNRTFDANHMGTMASLPRIWTEDGWTSTDVDVMCCFVVWMNKRKGWFRTAGNTVFGNRQNRANEDDGNAGGGKDEKGSRRAKLRRVRQLGVPGKGMVFKCRSRAERDRWVLNLNVEIERLVEWQKWEDEKVGGDVRLAG